MSEDTAPAAAAADRPDAEPTDHESPSEQTADEKLVPVSEAIRYRRRAQQAEQQLESLQERLAGVERELSTSRETVDQLERRHRIDALLSDADTVDLEAAQLLTEVAVSQMDEPDVRLAVEDLRRHKPYLFRHASPDEAGAMSPRRELDGHDPAEHAAEEAARTGDRRDLLRYLRMKRKEQ